MHRRSALVGLAAPFLPIAGGAAPAAAAADWPSRPIRLLLGVPPGGTLDYVVRSMQDGLEAALGQPIVVEYRPGEGGAVAQQDLARAPPDGYLLLMASTAPFAMTPHVSLAPFPALDRFTPVAQVATVAYAIVVRSDPPLRDGRDLRAVIGALPSADGGASYASAGAGSASHLHGELLADATGLPLRHRPAVSTNAAVADVIAGRADLLVDAVGTLLPEVRRGRLHAVAVTGGQRDAGLPAVPTVGEQGWAALQSVGFQGLVGPAGLPAGVVQRLAGEVSRVLQQPDVRRRLRDAGNDVQFRDGAAFAEVLRAERARWAALARQRGLGPS